MHIATTSNRLEIPRGMVDVAKTSWHQDRLALECQKTSLHPSGWQAVRGMKGRQKAMVPTERDETIP